MKISIEKIDAAARCAHEVNRAYCAALGDDSQKPWDESPAWQKTSAIAGVMFVIDNPDATPEDNHNSWMAGKLLDGWVYGEKKDPAAKTHPCMVPYADLPIEQQTKDTLFRAAVLGILK